MEKTPLLQIEKLTGVATGEIASSVFSARITLLDGSLASLASCIFVGNAGSGDAQNLARDIFEITSKKLEGAQGPLLEDLASARETVGSHIKSQEADASFVHIVFWRQAAYIVRHGKAVKVYISKGSAAGEISFESGSGPAENGQIYLAATDEFTKKLGGREQITNIENLEETVDGWATEISALANSAGIAAILVGVKGSGQQDEVQNLSKVENAEEVQSEAMEQVPVQEDQRDISEAEEQQAESGDLQMPDKSTGGREKLGLLAQKFLRVWKVIWSEIRKIRSSERLAILRLRRNLVLVVVVILIILAISAGLAIKNGAEQTKNANFNDHLLAASTKYGEGQAIVSLNRDRAREFFIGAGEEVGKALALKPKDPKAQELKGKIDSALRDSQNSEGLKFSTYSELESSLIALTLLGKNLVGVSSGKVYVIEEGEKSVSDIDGIEGVVAAYGFSDSVFVLANSGVYKINTANNKSEKIAESKQANDISVFIGNVYLLGQSQIYKYVPVEGGYVEGGTYVQGNFETNSKMAIDGNVWVSNGDKIFKYLKGEDQNFAISGLSTNGQFGKIYTNSELDNIYVVDSANRALLSIGKDDGIFKKAYQSDEFGRATGLVVDEAGGKIYISVENKILDAGL